LSGKGPRKNEFTDIQHCGAWLAGRKSTGISSIFRAFATSPGRMPQGLKCEVVFARALNQSTLKNDDTVGRRRAAARGNAAVGLRSRRMTNFNTEEKVG
jgi:hypothetical protein